MFALFVFLSLFVAVWAGPFGNAPHHARLIRRGSTKYVVAHFIVGNSYPYTVDNWVSDIRLAHQYGIDAFALNVGSDSWESQQVANASVQDDTPLALTQA